MAALLGGQCVDVACQPRFVASRCVAMQDAFLNRLINRRNRLWQQSLSFLGIARVNYRAQLFDGSAKASAIRRVNGIAARILAVALFSRSMIWHIFLKSLLRKLGVGKCASIGTPP